jgi:hypothetical protein
MCTIRTVAAPRAVLSRAAADVAEIAGNDTHAEIVGASDDCVSFIERLRDAGQ